MKALKFLGTIVKELLRIVAFTVFFMSMVIGLSHLVEAGLDKFDEWKDNRKSKKEAADELFNE